MFIWYVIIFFFVIFSILEYLGIYRGNIFSAAHHNGSVQSELLQKPTSLHILSFYLIAVTLLLLSALRFECGRDWAMYISWFEVIEDAELNVYKPAPIPEDIEWGFLYLNYFFYYYISSNFYVLQFCIALFCCWITYRHILKNTEFPISILMIYFLTYFFSVEMAQNRQFIAMAILMLGYPFIKKRQLLFWLLIVLLAMLFHISALLALPLYYTTNINVPKKFFFIVCAVTLIFAFVGKELSLAMLDISSRTLLPARLSSLADRYKNAEYVTGSFSTLTILVHWIFYFLGGILYYRTGNRTLKYQILNFLIAVFLHSISFSFLEFRRVSNYYLICGGGIVFYQVFFQKSFFPATQRVLHFFIMLLFILYNIIVFCGRWAKATEYSYQSVFFQ